MKYCVFFITFAIIFVEIFADQRKFPTIDKNVSILMDVIKIGDKKFILVFKLENEPIAMLQVKEFKLWGDNKANFNSLVTTFPKVYTDLVFDNTTICNIRRSR